MNERVPLSHFMPYGAPDLLVAARPDLARALAVASAAATLLFGLLGVLQVVHPSSTPAFPRPCIEILREPITPPLLPHPTPRVPAVHRTGASHAIGKVVTDEWVTEEPTFATADDIRPYLPGDPDGSETGDMVRLEPAPPETMPAFGEWQALEQLPKAIRTLKPEYPALAREAMVEGWVYVHVLVARDGRIADARVDARRHIPMLDQAALDAARRFEFEPALSNGRAVAAWVSIPFHFTLH
jgi:protein TonB